MALTTTPDTVATTGGSTTPGTTGSTTPGTTTTTTTTTTSYEESMMPVFKERFRRKIKADGMLDSIHIVKERYYIGRVRGHFTRI